MKTIAYYLPQYHPIKENDEWWGTGFTEWTNTAKARSLFPAHYQPHVPADLGFYDLRLPEAREAQANLAKAFGVEAFCYYHYWFGHGRRLLERPFNEVLASGKPNFPFCLCWANESWTGIWHGSPKKLLVEQTYPGRDDEERHFRELLPAFKDKRCVTVEGKPLFLVYSPKGLPHPLKFTEHWRSLALKAGLAGLYLVGVENAPWSPEEHGFDGATTRPLFLAKNSESGYISSRLRYYYRKWLKRPTRLYSYEQSTRHLLLDECLKDNVYPCAIPNWDNTPRSGLRGLVLHGSTPELFRNHFRAVLDQVRNKPAEHRIVFLKSWNEWAEGNHFEPDLKFGHQYLQVLRDEIGRFRSFQSDGVTARNPVADAKLR